MPKTPHFETERDPRRRSIEAVWNCGMGDDCLNLDEKGKHRGDNGYSEAQKCVHHLDPEALKRLKQR